MEIFIPLLIISLLILLNGLFVAAEFAIIAVPRTKISQIAEKGSKSAQIVLDILNDPVRQNYYITTAQLGITIVSLGLGMYGEHVIAEWILHWFEGYSVLTSTTAHTISIMLSVGLLTYLHVVIGEMIPKSLALQSAEKTVLKLNKPMQVMEKIFFPGIRILNKFSSIIIKGFGIPNMSVDARLYSPDELEYIIEESSEEGLVEERDLIIFENILDLQERNVAQAMTPRNKIIGISNKWSKHAIFEMICTAKKTRFPIYEDDLDQIVGILHIKDLARNFSIVDDRDGQDIDLADILRSPIFVPETLPILELLAMFKNKNEHIAIVFGEHGGTSGLVTLEDIIEEVVGEIQDEFDVESLPIEKINDLVFKIRGDVILDELNQHFDLEWSYPGTNTISGLIMSILGRMPQENDVVHYLDCKIEILNVDGFSIQNIKLTLPNKNDN